ncbi:mating-type protein Mat a-1, partial [Thozetella sp. PMI_491]
KKIRIRRPPNAYILYRKDHHELVKKAFPGIHNNQISTIIGAKWRNEDASVKLHYHNRATQLRNDLLKLFPDYKYQPRKPGEKKKR